MDAQRRGEKHVKNTSLLAVLTGCVVFGSVAHGQNSETAASSVSTQAGVPVEQLVALAAKKTGKKFVLDPRVHADVVLIGGAPADLTYPEFLTVLDVYGFAAVDDGKLVRIVPDAILRQQVTPTITAKDTRPGSEYVTEIITVKNVSAQNLIPILRPMVNQDGHMAAYPGANAVILSDRFD